MADDRLSALPDDVLGRVLYFASAKDAASTAVLSRRWRTLWLTSGALNLESRRHHVPAAAAVYYPDPDHDGNAGRAARERLVLGAEAALAAVHAHGGAVTRLTVHVEAAGNFDFDVGGFLTGPRFRDAVFYHPATLRVEELRVRVVPGLGNQEYLLKLNFGEIPSEALRVLHIDNFNNLKPPPPVSGAAAAPAFPRLTELHLHQCVLTLMRLQGIIDASPQLNILHLESCTFPIVDNVEQQNPGYHGVHVQVVEAVDYQVDGPCFRLVCPAVTHLVLANCTCYAGCKSHANPEGGLEIEAPSLRYFRYHAHLMADSRQLKLLGASNITEADLHLVVADQKYFRTMQIHEQFWQFILQFSAVRVLMLNMDFAIDRVAIVKNEGWDHLLRDKFFRNLKRLDLEGRYEPEINSAPVTIANLLHCCPVVRDFSLKLHRVSAANLHLPFGGPQQAQLDFNKSMDRFKRRRRATVSLGGDDDWNQEISDIPGLSEDSFDCLQGCLRRLWLQFRMDKPNCFGVQLAKFFASNALHLEEMHIDDGNHKMSEHMNTKVRRWLLKRSNSQTIASCGAFYHPKKR